MPGAIHLNRGVLKGNESEGGGKSVHDECSNLVGHYCLPLFFSFSLLIVKVLRVHERKNVCNLYKKKKGQHSSRQPLKVGSFCSGISDTLLPGSSRGEAGTKTATTAH